MLTDGVVKRFPTVFVKINTPYYKGTVKALCMENPIQELIVENTSGATGVEEQLKIHQSQPKVYTLFWRFDLITRSSSEEAGTQFFRVLMRRSAVASRKRS